MFRILFTLFVLCVFATPALAGTKFGKKCPYSCQMLGIDKAHCKDWKEKGKCYVEVASGARGSRKAVLKKKCPLSCKSMGIAKPPCKDYKEGKKCVVEF